MRSHFCGTLRRSLALAVITLAVGSYPALADAPLVIGSGEVGGENSSYASLGVIDPLPGSHFGDGWITRAISETYSYRYKSGDRTIDARVWGGTVDLGYQISDSNGWLGAYAGPSYHDTVLLPDDMGNSTRGGEFSARLEMEGEYRFTNDFKVNGIANYDAFGTDAYWTRARLLYRVDGSMFAGPEAVYQGDNKYQAWSAGVTLVGIQITKTATIGFDAGINKTQNFSPSPYVGLEFGVGF